MFSHMNAKLIFVDVSVFWFFFQFFTTFDCGEMTSKLVS